MQSHIAVELVPRDLELFEQEVIQVKAKFPQISLINIPDLKRLKHRSWEAAKVALNYYPNVIPHLRARDFDLSQGFNLSSYLLTNQITEVLVVTGDPVLPSEGIDYDTTALDLIDYIKKNHPEISVYATIDPYRNRLQKEFDYIRQKEDAGVDGYFTQPFFDMHLLKAYLDLLSHYPVFFGISPVNSPRSKQYWEKINNVVFPKHFHPVRAWNIQTAKEALKMVKDYNQSLYFMPIRDDTCGYLSDIFD